jgi:hypothetical protein
MKRIILAAILAVLGLVWAAPAAYAGEPASSTWGDVWNGRDANQQQVDLNRATDVIIARRGGFGPSIVNNNSTTNIGEQNIETTIMGDSISSGATNSVNSNSSTTTVGAGSSNVVITTRTTQDSGTATQAATAQTTSTGPNGTSGVTAATSN